MDFNCNTCNKIYKSYQSLWNHNKKFHNDICSITTTKINQISTNINQLSTKKYICKHCNKSYNIIQSRWKHEQKCKSKNNNENEFKK